MNTDLLLTAFFFVITITLLLSCTLLLLRRRKIRQEHVLRTSHEHDALHSFAWRLANAKLAREIDQIRSACPYPKESFNEAVWQSVCERLTRSIYLHKRE